MMKKLIMTHRVAKGFVSRRRKGKRGYVLIEVLISMTLFVLMFQSASLTLEFSLAVDQVVRRQQTADFCLRGISEYFNLMSYGAVKLDAAPAFGSWRLMSAADSFGVKDFLQQMEAVTVAPTGNAIQLICTNNAQMNMQWRIRQPTNATINLANSPGCTFNWPCYDEGPNPGLCQNQLFRYIVEVSYDTPSLSHLKTRRVVSYMAARYHDCRPGL